MKTCIRCGIEKKNIAFIDPNGLVCKKCNVKKQVEKSKKFANSESKGIKFLDKNAKINILHKYLRPHRILPYDKAIEYIQSVNVPYIVYDKDTVYFTKFVKPEREDILLRVNVLERDNFTCYYCNRDANTVDHVIPKSKGGQFIWKNLVTSCARCNNNLKKNELLSRKEMKKIILDDMIEKSLNSIKNKWD